MSLRGENVVKPFQIRMVGFNAADAAAGPDFVRKLIVLDAEGHFVGNDLPAAMAVERYGKRIKNREAFAEFPHLLETVPHQYGHETEAGILRIGCDAGYEADLADPVEDVHL